MSRILKVILTIGLAARLFADVSPEGTILEIDGNVKIFQDKNWTTAENYQPVYRENIIRAGKGSSAELMFDDDTVVRFEENTEAQILIKDNVPEVSVKTGRITSSVVPNEDIAFYVSSPLAIIGVRGTEFTVTQGENGTDVAVFKGRVEVSDRSKKAEKIRVVAGKQTFVYRGKHPSPPVGLSPEYKKYRKKVLKKFIKRVVTSRKNKNKILLKRMKKIKKRQKQIINKIRNRKIKFRKPKIREKESGIRNQ
ncbi:MAG: FecR domain-containing protein [Elusimicrobia bacterium]|nr:FecR domain-containing protein [Elusimicrobiota bacterium]